MFTQRSCFDQNFLNSYNKRALSDDNKAEFYGPMKSSYSDMIQKTYNMSETPSYKRSLFDSKYSNKYKPSEDSNVLEFYNKCNKCNSPSSFSSLQHSWTPGYFGKGQYNVNDNLNYTEKAMKDTAIMENFNWTPANTRLTTEDPENIYSYFTGNCSC